MAVEHTHPRWSTPAEVAARFGRLVRRTRRDKELTLKQVADNAGITFAYLAKIERGELPPPAEDKLYRIAETLGLPVQELLWSAGRMSEEATAFVARYPRHCEAVLSVIVDAAAGTGKVAALVNALIRIVRENDVEAVRVLSLSPEEVKNWIEDVKTHALTDRSRPRRLYSAVRGTARRVSGADKSTT